MKMIMKKSEKMLFLHLEILTIILKFREYRFFWWVALNLECRVQDKCRLNDGVPYHTLSICRKSRFAISTPATLSICLFVFFFRSLPSFGNLHCSPFIWPCCSKFKMRQDPLVGFKHCNQRGGDC